MRPTSDASNRNSFAGPVGERKNQTCFRIAMLSVAVATTLPVVFSREPDASKCRSSAIPVQDEEAVWIAVTGDVDHPGIYKISANNVAHGVTKMAVTQYPFGDNALQIIDTYSIKAGTELDVKNSQSGTADITIRKMPVAARLLLELPLDINEMEEVDFDLLPGVGPLLAKKIYRYRQNNGGVMAVGDLRNVEGVGEKRCSRLGKFFK